MERESCLALVRTLTEQVLTAAGPEKLGEFAEDFADFTVSAEVLQVAERPALQRAQARGWTPPWWPACSLRS